MPKKPAIHIYPGDWYRDNVAGCSIGAQGLWFRMILIGHDSERYGYLQQNGVAIPPESIARRCGCTPEQYTTLLLELDGAGVPSRTPEGIIFSRRMVRDEQDRVNGNNRVKKHRSNGHVTSNVMEMKHPTSSSTSSSTSKNISPLPPLNREEWVHAILKAHPAAGQEWGHAAENAVIEAIITEAKDRKWEDQQAYEYVLARTQLYAQCVERWPESELQWVTGAITWFTRRKYNQPEAKWKRGSSGKPTPLPANYKTPSQVTRKQLESME